ncbi:DUF4082 domain-containing protein [Flavobacterium sp. WW92]|uniref:DUF4082 domain-containing protein n=1 Tax=unclassified Flavobacterium TaxID=196869 RepID=UPI0022240210|nr:MULTISPECIES: DUF4082 domain-containing protein [unclassified Flavobacterium]WDO14132.1 DUF4082 domain-containing protein [Flavobacterium sp. WW92]
MKTIKILSGALLAIFAISCSSDDSGPSYAVENPLESYHQQAGFTTTSNFINAGSYEFGLAFSPNVKGVIKAITLKLPEANPEVRVTIWDYDTKAVLRSENMNVATADVLVTKTISDLALEKDKKYLITMNSNDWYKRSKADNTNATYPITAGNIKFLEYRWVSGATQTYPTNVSLNYNGGDLSFDFKQTE